MPAERRAAYRLQLNPDFTLEDAGTVAGYLARLGVSHVYCSPVLQAAPGSTHGYDVVDPQRVSEALGGAAAWGAFVQRLRDAGLAVLLDIVPNHMAIGTGDNPWWWDVLENGAASRFAPFFDVNWRPPEQRNANQVLLPVLGDQYGVELEAGRIQLARAGAAFTVTYYEQRYPVDPASLAFVLQRAATRYGSRQLGFLADAYARLPDATQTGPDAVRRRYRDQRVLDELLGRLLNDDPAFAEALDGALSAINGDPDALDELLRRQNYRLAFWRVGEGEMSYRRFFNINSLIGLRVEDESVFAESHRLALRWVEEGAVDGLRIDHVDGLRDPEGYLQRLAAAAPDAWLLVEKILEHGERLPPSWPIAGTTGYDFLAELNALFVNPAGEAPLTAFYARFTGEPADYAALVQEKKWLVLETILASDLERLADLLLQIVEQKRRYRDYTRAELRELLGAVAATMPVYRTYVRPGDREAQLRARKVVGETIDAVGARRPDIDARLLAFLRDLLLLSLPKAPETSALEAEFVARWQQFTGPVMAKGVEDTTFYNYNRFISLNEVGGDPSRFGLAPDEFHAAMARRQEQWPHALLATSTHDTKRSEDVRARLNVLAGMPAQWEQAVLRWAEQAAPYRSGALPDAADEYLLYQTIAGAWPISAERLQAYMLKAARESKRHTSWANMDEVYEQALAAFVSGVMADEALQADLAAFVEPLRLPGWHNSLAQTLLKLTAPGVPDIYQGTELWDFSLVDPDNRRPVDFDQRRALLDWLAEEPAPEAILARIEEGLPKLHVVRRALALRAARPELFGPGATYRPLPVEGSDAALAFARGDGLVTAVPRYPLRALQHGWGEAALVLLPGEWRHAFTGERFPAGPTRLDGLFGRFPVALLHRLDARDPSSQAGSRP